MATKRINPHCQEPAETLQDLIQQRNALGIRQDGTLSPGARHKQHDITVAAGRAFRRLDATEKEEVIEDNGK